MLLSYRISVVACMLGLQELESDSSSSFLKPVEHQTHLEQFGSSPAGMRNSCNGSAT